MPHRVIKTPTDLTDLFKLFEGFTRTFTVEWIMGQDRTGQQNRLQWLWANEAATQTGSEPDDVQADWKLRHGVPILRAESTTFREKYDRYIRPYSYEEKLEIMRDLGVEVSSVMKVPQMIRYLDSIWAECAETGIKLTEPDPDLAKYQARYRLPEEAAA